MIEIVIKSSRVKKYMSTSNRVAVLMIVLNVREWCNNFLAHFFFSFLLTSNK